MKGPRWQVNTERVKETHRFGYGYESLHETLKHLQSRGDKTCVYMVGSGADGGFIKVDLKTYVMVAERTS